MQMSDNYYLHSGAKPIHNVTDEEEQQLLARVAVQNGNNNPCMHIVTELSIDIGMNAIIMRTDVNRISPAQYMLIVQHSKSQSMVCSGYILADRY